MAYKCCKFLTSLFCCSTCPFGFSSRITRIIFLSIFASCVLGNIILPRLISSQQLPFCKGSNNSDCQYYPHYLMIYRISFSFYVFFMLMHFIVIGVSRSRNWRGTIQNGFWFLKISVLILILTGALHIPPGSFDYTLMFIGLISSLMFCTVELLLFMQLSHSFTKCLVLFWFQGSYLAFAVLFVFTILCLNSAVMLTLFLLIFYENCTINLCFVIIHAVIGYTLLIGSVFVDQVNQRIGVLQGGVMSFYVMSLTWSALTNNPDEECYRPKQASHVAFAVSNYYGILRMLIIIIYITIRSIKPLAIPFDVNVQIEERGNECCGIWGKRRIIKTIEPGTDGEISNEDPRYITTDENDDEYEYTRYHWARNHILYANATLYMMLSLTRWYVPDTHEPGSRNSNPPAMWFKAVTCWICFVIYFHLICIPRPSNRAPQQ